MSLAVKSDGEVVVGSSASRFEFDCFLIMHYGRIDLPFLEKSVAQAAMCFRVAGVKFQRPFIVGDCQVGLSLLQTGIGQAVIGPGVIWIHLQNFL